MKQLEYLKKAVQLKIENPEAEIHICVDSEEVLSDVGWTAHKITRVELGYWYSDDGEEIYTDIEDVVDVLSFWHDRDISEEEAYTQMQRAILIYTHAG